MPQPKREILVHGAAGNKLRQIGSKGIHVVLVHEGMVGSGIGCGALGSLNPEKAGESIRHLWHGMEELGVRPEKFFSVSKEQMTKEKLTGIVKKLNLSNHSHEHAREILMKFGKAGKPVIVGVFAHEDGTIEHKGSANLKDAAGEKIVNLSICSDARVPEAAAKKYFKRVIKSGMGVGEKIELKKLVAPNAKTQQPSRILVHEPQEMPRKTQGKTFNVTQLGKFDLDELLSIAYALTHFGPKTNVNSLSSIEVTRPEAYNDLTRRLEGLEGGIKLLPKKA